MLNNEEFLQLRTSYVEIGKLVQKYGGQYSNGILNMLIGQINCIDSDENNDKKLQYLISNHHGLFVSKGGLSDFVIYVEDRELRNQLNKRLDEEEKKVWSIMKEYV